MKLPRRRFLRLAAGAAALPTMSCKAIAQTYPTRPITIVVPFPAGGPTDIVARILAEPMKVTLGQSVVVENVSGAGGTIGVGRVTRASPDGYTLGAGNSTSHVGSPAIYPIQYDVLKDIEPIALLPLAPAMIVARSTLPANNVLELISWLKENSTKASAGTVGAGSASHLSGIHFQNQTGTRFQFVPYRGGAPAMQDLVAGQIDLRFGAEGSQCLPYLRSGQIKALAVMGKARWSAAPNVPTIDEAGLPGIYLSVWNGLWAPKGVNKEIIVKLNSSVVNAFADPTILQRIANQGLLIPPRDQQTPEALAAFHKAEIERWWPIIKAANIKPE